MTTTKAGEQPTITQSQYESAVKGRQDFRNAYRNLLPVLRAAEELSRLWRTKGQRVDDKVFFNAINAIDVAVTGGGAKPDPEHLTRTTSLAAQVQQVLALVEAARDAGDVLQSAASPSNLDPQYSDQIAALGERIGYGALMHGASALWRKSLGDLSGSEFAAGPCVSTAASRLARLDDALMPFRGETLPDAPSLAAQDGLVEALRDALKLAANRFDRLGVNAIGDGRAAEAHEISDWSQEARASARMGVSAIKGDKS